jgi:hypothetical protein
MFERLRDVWIPATLFCLSLTAALGLAGAVIAAPWLASEEMSHPLIELYARDVAVRRVSLVSALGLAVTAFVFFRPASWRKPKDRPDVSSVAGA